MRSPILLALSLLPCISVAQKQAEEVLRLVCEYSYSIKGDGSTGATSGKDFFTIRYQSNGRASIEKSGLGTPYEGVVTDDQIYAEVTYQIGENDVLEVLQINRYTGEMSISFEANGKSGLVHFGKCRVVTERLF